MIQNCPVTTRDFGNAEFIWGKDLGSVKGKTVRHKPRQRVITPGTNIPLTIMQQYRDVTLSVDIMKVTGIPFLMTISKHIKLGSGGRLTDMKNETMLKHFKSIIGAYSIRGFRVKIVLADNQFESMRGDIADLHADLVIVSADEHVPDIERFIRTIKERVRADWNMMPFEQGPPSFVAELVYRAIFWRNMFPLKNGISHTQSPGEIVLNRKLDFNLHCRVEVFQYVQTTEKTDNSMNPRTVGAIATRPSGDGSYNFVSLHTGRVLNRREFIFLPMPEDARERMHALAERAKISDTLTFMNRDNLDLDTLYADLERDEDDLPLDALIAGVGNDNNEDDEDDEDYIPNENGSDNESDNNENGSDNESDNDEDNESASDDDNDAADNDGAEIPGVTDNEEDEMPEEDAENAGVVDNEEEEMQQDDAETAGVADNEEDDMKDNNEDEPVEDEMNDNNENESRGTNDEYDSDERDESTGVDSNAD